MNVLQHTRNERNLFFKRDRADRYYRDCLLSNRCGKHLCVPRFHKCGFAENHSLNSHIREFCETAEIILAMVLLSVNSTDKR